MRKIEKKTFFTTGFLRKLERILKPKHKYHKSNIVGEDLPMSLSEKLNIKILIAGFILSLAAVLFFTYGINFIIYSLAAIKNSSNNLTNLKMDFSFNLKYFKFFGNPKQNIMINLCIIFSITLLFYLKMNRVNEKNLVYGQKGDSRFTTIKEIKNEYHEIPESKQNYEGIGGVPVSHYKDKYYIDRDTVNTIALGASRSGKGETFVVPLIDILTRANDKSNMVVNDPKGELYSASKHTLEKRGYRVLVLNIDDPLQSMSFNPLQLVIDSWANKNYHEASKRANTLTSMLFSSGMGTDNEFFYKSAKSAINAIILTIVEHCFDNNCVEKITMYNVAQMLNELGSLFYTDPKNPMKEKNALDEYFNNLPQGNQAKIQYGSTSFAGDKAKGSILSTASQGIEMFTSDLFGKMTSQMSIDLKEIGFPKNLQFTLDNELVGKRVTINFLRKEENRLSCINTYKIKVKALGLCVLNFDENLKSGDILDIRYEDSEEKYRSWYSLELPNEKNQNYSTSVITKKFKSGNNFTDLDIKSLSVKYTDQPTTIFMVVPDYDPSNHIICSIFISQLYTELASNCKDTPSKKCFRRVHFLLDEFGNMPAIDNMEGILTVCLGRNILFDLVIQSYKQLEAKYDKKAQIIKENCQNHILIMSNDADTIEEISKKCGNKTTISKSSSAKHLDTDNSLTTSAEQERIISTDRASQLIEGEQIILRNLHRQDKNRNKIRAFPIFNTKETNMPYRYQFLSDEFNTAKDINDIDIECTHINLSLNNNLIPFSTFIRDLVLRLQYSITNNILVSQLDYSEYKELPLNHQILDENDLKKLVEKKEVELDLKTIDSKINSCFINVEKVETVIDDEKIMRAIEQLANENSILQSLLRKELTSSTVVDNQFKFDDTIQQLQGLIETMPMKTELKQNIIQLNNSISILNKSL